MNSGVIDNRFVAWIDDDPGTSPVLLSSGLNVRQWVSPRMHVPCQCDSPLSHLLWLVQATLPEGSNITVGSSAMDSLGARSARPQTTGPVAVARASTAVYQNSMDQVSET
jgi:hypothetical protein